MVRNEFERRPRHGAHVLIPFAVFPLASAMRSVDERVLLAARRARRLSIERVFWRVFLPMTLPGVIAGSALITFVFTLGFFVTPAILGGGRSIMVAELVYLSACFKAPIGVSARRISVVRWSPSWAHSDGGPAIASPGLAHDRGLAMTALAPRRGCAHFGRERRRGLPAAAAPGGRADLPHAGPLPVDAAWHAVADPLP